MIQHRENQREKLRRALESAPFNARHPGGPGRWLGVDSIMRLGIAQYSARLHELRADGFAIENWRQLNDATGQMESWYKITKWPDPEPKKENQVEEIKA